MHALGFAGDVELREDRCHPCVPRGVADPVLASRVVRGVEDELVGLGVVPGLGADGTDVRAVSRLAHGEATRQIQRPDIAQVGGVVLVGAQSVNRATEEPELHAHLHEQRQVAVPHGLEGRDPATGVVLAAVLRRERAGAVTGLADRAGPLQDEVAIILAGQPVGLLEVERRQPLPSRLPQGCVRTVKKHVQSLRRRGIHRMDHRSTPGVHDR